MSTINVPFLSSADYKPSKAAILRRVMADKLTTAAQEIFAVVERTVAGYEEEASALRQEIERQRRQLEAVLQPQVSLCRIDVEASDGQVEEEEGEDDDDDDDVEESAEEPVQSTSPNQEDLRDLDHQIQKRRGWSLKMNHRMRRHVNLRVRLLKDSHTNTLIKGMSKSAMQTVRCQRSLREPEFLDLLRSTFPQLTGEFDVFTLSATKRLTPLKLLTLTPEEIQKSIKSTGKGRSALYIRLKRAQNSRSITPQSKNKARNGLTNNENQPSSSPVEEVENNNAHHLCSDSGQQQQMETERYGEQHGISDDFSAPTSEADDEVEEDDRDDNWKPHKDDEESEAEQNLPETTGKQQAKHSGGKTKRGNRRQSTDNSHGPLSCKVCHALSGSMNMLVKHARIHVDDPEQLCGVCGERAESAEELRSHLESHQKTHSCTTCGKCFVTYRGLHVHAVLHTGERPYKCDICHKTYAQKRTLDIHQWDHVEQKPHKCDVCNQSFFVKTQLRIHNRIHTGEKPYRCDECGKSLTNLRSLSRHKLAHIGVKRYSCRVCGKRFLTPALVKHHEKIHTDRDRPYLCDVCCKTFHTRPQLNAHLKTHSEQRTMCNQCGKGLSSEGALRRHMLIHTGERPYECSICGQSFNCMSTLRNHQKMHAGIKPYVCGVCGKACARKAHLTIHMRTHNGEKPYQCSVCEKAFTQSHCLKTHMKTHRGEEKSAVEELLKD